MKRYFEAEVPALIHWERIKDKTGLVLLRGDITLTYQSLLDKTHAFADHMIVSYEDLIKEEITQRLVSQVRTQDVEDELRRLREVEYEHLRCVTFYPKL